MFQKRSSAKEHIALIAAADCPRSQWAVPCSKHKNWSHNWQNAGEAVITCHQEAHRMALNTEPSSSYIEAGWWNTSQATERGSSSFGVWRKPEDYRMNLAQTILLKCAAVLTSDFTIAKKLKLSTLKAPSQASAQQRRPPRGWRRDESSWGWAVQMDEVWVVAWLHILSKKTNPHSLLRWWQLDG